MNNSLSVSLADPIEKYDGHNLPFGTMPKVSEMRAGIRLFNDAVTDVHMLHTTYRFRDQEIKEWDLILPDILAYMRRPAGRPMPDHLWQALAACQVKNRADSRLRTPKQKKAFEIATNWAQVARMIHLRA